MQKALKKKLQYLPIPLFVVAHAKKTKRIVVSLKDINGHAVKLKWKKDGREQS